MPVLQGEGLVDAMARSTIRTAPETEVETLSVMLATQIGFLVPLVGRARG